jgi:hypothetical protein
VICYELDFLSTNLPPPTKGLVFQKEYTNFAPVVKEKYSAKKLIGLE